MTIGEQVSQIESACRSAFDVIEEWREDECDSVDCVHACEDSLGQIQALCDRLRGR